MYGVLANLISVDKNYETAIEMCLGQSLQNIVTETEEDAKKLIDSVINNLAILIEIKEIEVITKIDEKAIFIADYKWQKEALINGEKLSSFLSGKVDCRRYKRITIDKK